MVAVGAVHAVSPCHTTVLHLMVDYLFLLYLDRLGVANIWRFVVFCCFGVRCESGGELPLGDVASNESRYSSASRGFRKVSCWPLLEVTFKIAGYISANLIWRSNSIVHTLLNSLRFGETSIE